MSNIVYIATSLDGYIADRDGNLEWLNTVPNPNGLDFGYKALLDRVDALVIGRVTYETILGFDVEWPYEKPVFVLSNTLDSVADSLAGKVKIINGPIETVQTRLGINGFKNLYIDGGSTIQSFLREGLIDELIITVIPVLLGGGVSLFGDLSNLIQLEVIKTEVFLNSIVQNHYIIKR